MNKLTKIGVSALAGSLVAVSAHAGSLSASGSASISFADGDVDEVVVPNTTAAPGLTPEGNQWSMSDSITMTGSGDMDNGMSVSVSFEIDNDDVGGGNVYDSHSITLDTNGMGTLTFAGHGGDGAVSAIDDKTPNAYEESWDGVTDADEETVPNGLSSDNMFTYKSADLSGTTITVGYVPSGVAGKTPKDGYMDFSVVNSNGLVDGLTVGLGMGESEEVVGTTIDNTILYGTYTTGGLTVGVQKSEADGSTSATTVDFQAVGIAYAITDDLTVAYNESVSDNGNQTVDQEASGISASYTSGGVTIAGMINDVENVGFDEADDTEGYEFNISFAF